MNVIKLTSGLIAAGLLLVYLEGCATTTASTVAALPEGNVRRLLQSYPQEAEQARQVAPAFTRDALKTISALEEMILLRNARAE